MQQFFSTIYLTPEAMGQYARANAVVPAREGLPVIKEVAELQEKRFHVIDVEASSRDYERRQGV